MHNFQFFVHRTAGLIKDINSAPGNFPEGGFYQESCAVKYAASIHDKRNFTAIYDARGTIVHLISP